ncbi:hypothetical protein [Gynuella sunshinyii]|uniref:Uncharacterized protein n=1 Tax=Gynuella sunshinyii YC6258 TaxID=1445510 RepID=A0A0C5VTD9_9GAMM|nr:hypothetical protein [Gynuella sunshinyii]AJQ97952.1 hypothetical Protein YC6258_05928 [Gynuella sunshinyii YC6258]
MKHGIKKTLVALAVAAGTMLPAFSWAASNCSDDDIIENRLPAITFVPFSRTNPETNLPYDYNDTIEITLEDGSTKTVNALEYLDELDDTESSLNAWGYSLREDGTPTISQLNYCFESLQDQAGLIDEQIREEHPGNMMDDLSWKEKWDLIKKAYEQQAPSWDDLYAMADNEDYEVYLPEVPKYTAPTVTFEPRPIEFSKEKTHTFYTGSMKGFSVGIFPYYKFGASKVEAVAEAGVKVDGSLAGQWTGNIATVKLHGRSPGSGPMKVDFTASALDGKITWNKPLVEYGSLRYEDSIKDGITKSVKYRFAVGPIPMSAELGMSGEVGYRWGFELYALQVGAWTGPWAALDAWAQVGVDVWIGGAGVGGQLTIAHYSLTLQGSGQFEWVEEPQIRFQIAALSDLNLLSGDIYAFAWIKYPSPTWKNPFRLKKKEWRHSFFSWTGYHNQGTLFDYSAVYNRYGLVAQGDLSIEDIAEVDLVNREAAIEQAEMDVAQEAHYLAQSVYNMLNQNDSRNIPQVAGQIVSASETTRANIDEYWQLMSEWIEL